MRTLLIVGAGDVARRALPYLVRHWHVIATCRNPRTADLLRAAGAVPLFADLDRKASLQKLANLADDVLISAPPPASGHHDARTRKLLCALAKGKRIPQRLVYISTSGVYGNADGNWLSEHSPTRPDSERAHRRLDAETQLRHFAGRHGSQLVILRAPGIYADERLPLSRFASGTPLIRPEEDSWSNHIHADDLARLCVRALRKNTGGIRVFNACDDQPLQVGEWYRLLGKALGLPVLPECSRAEVKAAVSPMLWSYLAESRRLDNRRLRQELGFTLRWPGVSNYLDELAADTVRRAAALATMPKIL